MSSKSRQAAKKKNPKSTSKEGNVKKAEPDGSRLPFEPIGRKKTTPKADQSSQQTATPTPSAKAKSEPKTSKPAAAKTFAGVPEAVSQRMVRRMAVFCGLPTLLGMLTFVVSYVIVSQHWFDLPTVAVLFSSLGFFGLGVLGLSYGALSASWDEDRLGSWLGWGEFRTNFGRTVESWRSARQKASQE